MSREIYGLAKGSAYWYWDRGADFAKTAILIVEVAQEKGLSSYWARVWREYKPISLFLSKPTCTQIFDNIVRHLPPLEC